jgi:hypothetical protein
MNNRANPADANEQARGVGINDSSTVAKTLYHEADMMELALLLPSRQVAALEGVACKRGLAMAQLIRQLISDFLANEDLLRELDG